MGNIVRKLPIGIQSFDKLRTENYLYVDKTEFIYQMAYQGVPYFLSRPRRFGKSLLLSTFKAYFEGKKELFRGLAIEKLETEWKEHPVLHFSLNAELYDSRKALENMLERQLREWEKIYDTGGEGITYSGRFMTIIRRAAEITGRKVVVLIDEYDKPLLRNLHNEELQNEFRELLTAFYTVLKDADPWLRFVFITGVTKFAQVGIFSNLNHLNDISLAPQYAALCGMTLPEIEATFQPELHALAEANKLSYEGTIEKITRRYDGYHFDFRSGIALYNPFSVLNVLSKQVFYDYWFASGTPTFLAEMLRKTNYDIRELDGIEVSEVSLSDDRANINNPVPMIYQSGYLTIKSYDEEFRLYTLGYPNEEVKYGFLNFVASMYAHLPETETPFYIGRFIKELRSGNTEAISHDSCQGRKPFSEGADRAVNYIAHQMKEVGLKPINGDSYFQQVNIISSRTRCPDPMVLKTPKGKIPLDWLEGYTAFSARIEPEIDIDNAELVFAGYGIVAPEYGKNDFEGIENPQDKVAVVIVNDPGLGSDNTDYFNGDIMTYYGRWMYKFEEGARQGLKGVLIIHEDRGAGYPWSVVRASAQSKMYVDSDSDAYHCPLNGWIQFNAAKQLLADNGYDIDQLIEQSKSPDFKPISLKSTVTVSMRNTFDRQQSPNVIGYIPGSGNTDESVIYLGHWDHLGYGAPINGDSIINGATDNAVAIAWMLEMARCFNALKEKPRRNIVFLSPTCEETGFLGTKYYVEHPLFPIDKIAAVINLDVFPLWGENNDVTITGYGNSELDDTLAELAKKYNRYIMPDPDAYNGMFYRSDHFPFVQKGIPAMFAKGWNDNRKQGKEWAKEHIARYWAETYHKPTDQTHPDTDDYSGLLQEVQLFFDLGYKLAQDTGYPKWKPKSEFANVLKR